MADGGGEIGRTYVRVDADLTPLEAKLNQIPAKVNAATTGGGSGGSSGSGGIPGAGGGGTSPVSPQNDPVVQVFRERRREAEATTESVVRGYEQQVGAVTRFIGKLAAIGGVVVTFYRVGEAIREAFENRLDKATDSAERFKQSLDFENTEAALARIDKQIADVQSRLAGRQEQNFLSKAIGFVRGESIAAFEAEAESLEQTRSQLQGKIDAERAASEAKEDADRKARNAKQIADERAKTEELFRQVQAARIKSLPEEARIGNELANRLQEIDLAIYKETNEERKRLLQELRQYEIETARVAREKITAAEDEAVRRQVEKEAQMREDMARRVADATSAAIARAFTVSDSSLERIEVGINRLVQIIELRQGDGL